LDHLDLEVKVPEDLLTFCNLICGERAQQYLVDAIKKHLATCLGFENAYVLNYEQGKLLALNYFKNEQGELVMEKSAELPSTMGLTGKCITRRQIVISNKGREDPDYNASMDNIMKLPRIESMMIVPLLVNHNKVGEPCIELVGVLQLINNKLGDANKVNKVYLCVVY